VSLCSVVGGFRFRLRQAASAQQESFVFGTRVEVLVADADAAKRQRRRRVPCCASSTACIAAYHAWQPSELTALNEAIAGRRTHPVSTELAGFVADAQRVCRRRRTSVRPRHRQACRPVGLPVRGVQPAPARAGGAGGMAKSGAVGSPNCRLTVPVTSSATGRSLSISAAI
jgi:hypothetical protein